MQTRKDNFFDIAIIGAGIVGAACADECSREGMSVAIIEADAIGSGATAAGMGHIVVMDDSDAQFALTDYSRKLWNDLELPKDVEYESCGTIWVAADEEEMQEVHRKQEYYSKRNVRTEILDERSLEEAEPNLRKGMKGGLLVKNDSVIYPPCAARFFVEQALSRNTSIFLRHKVIEITNEGVRLDNSDIILAKIVVNAAGSLSPILTPGIDVQKRKGHLVITDRYPGFVNHQLVELGYLKSAHSLTSESVAFNVQPRATGQILLGSSRQYGVEDKSIDSHILNQMIERAFEYMPQMRDLSVIRTWTGFRAATKDKLPLIGPHPERNNLYLATGHEGLGITTSLGTAKLLVDQLMNRKPAIPVEPYLPSRYKVRAGI